jgi:signal transduction histidine kinase
LRREDRAAVLEVDDDGRGFDPAAGTTGMGLTNLRERVASMGGRIRIESSLGEGTMIALAIPLAG